jgi:hypothetical protein
MLMTGSALQSEKEKYGATCNANASNIIQACKSLFGWSPLDVELQTQDCQNERDAVERQIDVDCRSSCQLKVIGQDHLYSQHHLQPTVEVKTPPSIGPRALAMAQTIADRP